MALGVLAVAVVLSVGGAGWQAYERHLRPQARIVPSATPTPVNSPETRAEQARRSRLAIDLVGEASAHLRAGDRATAQRLLREALELDPTNQDARGLQRDLGGLDGLTPLAPRPPGTASATPAVGR
jgi:hypothetical protein